MAAPVQYNSLDPNALIALKRGARENSPEAIKATAQQFEALFMQMVMKSMREASPGDGGLFDNEGTKMYRDMYDQQLVGVLAKQGGLGLAAALERQMLAAQGLTPQAAPASGLAGARRTGAGRDPVAVDALQARVPQFQAPVLRPRSDIGGDSGAAGKGGNGPRGFVDGLWSHASSAAERLGVPAHFLVGHAALETGWGKYEIRKADGSPSHNLFNVKAGSSWKGEVVEKKTVEYINGKPETRVERFRAYGSYEEAFNDYARLLSESPRYAKALGAQDAQSFSRALHQGGYATDPAYAGKLARVINGPTLRQSMIALASSQ